MSKDRALKNKPFIFSIRTKLILMITVIVIITSAIIIVLAVLSFRGDNQVALVFAVLIVHDDDHAPLTQVLDDFFSGVQCHRNATGSANGTV